MAGFGISQTLSVVSGIAQTVGNLFGNGGAAVQLGSFGFTGFEVPETMPFGGEAMTTEHRYAGGSKTVDMLGVFRDDMTWSGLFIGANANSRAQALGGLFLSGQPQRLTWGSYSRTVLIKSFKPVYHRENYVRYSITVIVLDVQQPRSTASTLLGSLTNDINSALGINLGDTLSSVSNTLTAVAPAITAVASIIPGSSSAMRILDGLNTTQNAISGASSLANGQITGILSAVGSFEGGASMATSMLSLGNVLNNASNLNMANNLVGRMISNIGNPSN